MEQRHQHQTSKAQASKNDRARKNSSANSREHRIQLHAMLD